MSKLAKHDAEVYSELQKLAAIVPGVRLTEVVAYAFQAITKLEKVKRYCENYCNGATIIERVLAEDILKMIKDKVVE